jgi:hypothetical protein
MKARQLLGWGLIGVGGVAFVAALAMPFANALGGQKWLWLIGLLIAAEALSIIGALLLGPDVLARLKRMMKAPADDR